MDGAFMALGLSVTELAPVQPRGRVYQQLPALLTKFLFFVLFKAPQFNHVSDCKVHTAENEKKISEKIKLF